MIFNIGKYNTHWATETLSNLGVFARGKSRHRPRNDAKLFEDGKYPLVQTGEIKDAILYINHHSSKYGEFGLQQSKLWNTGTLCITIAANIAETAILEYPMCFPDSIVGFTAFPEKTSELFMHYVFTFIRGSIQNSVTGSIQDNINIDYLTSLEFKVPLKNEQDKITHILSSLDNKIDTNNCINAELEAMAKTIYDYWFVQFDFPNENGKPYKSSGGKMVYNEEIKREIPVGWEVQELVQIESNIVTGKTPATTNDSFYIGDIPFITIGDMHNNIFITKTEQTLSALGAESQCNKYIPEDSICVSCIATIGILSFSTTKSQTNQQINTIICKQKENQPYVYFALKNYFRFSHVAKSGATFANMNKGEFSSIKILYPLDTRKNEFYKIVKPIFAKMKNNSFENQELTQLRDWFLPMLMNGQVRVGGE